MFIAPRPVESPPIVRPLVPRPGAVGRVSGFDEESRKAEERAHKPAPPTLVRQQPLSEWA